MKNKTVKGMLLLGSLTFFSCKEKTTGLLQISGEIKNIEAAMTQFPGIFKGDSIMLSLYEVPFGSETVPVKLDSTFISSANNSFTLEAQANVAGLYDVLIENGPMIPLVNDDNKIRLEIDLTQNEKYYNVSGSPASNQLRDFLFGYSEKSNAANIAFKKLDSLKMYSSEDSSVIDATDSKNNTLKEVNDYVTQTIEKVNHPIVAAFVLGTGSNTLPEKEYETALNKMTAKYPADASLNFLKNQLAESRNQQTQAQQTSWIGKPAPEMTMPDKNGKEVSLASFKGKYVLVDFWASWCRPCREENPNVVRAYKTFGNRNFTVLGVSLDKDKENWIQAIEKDKLTWTHISDLAFWDSKSVELFKFQGIPYNVLVGPDGIVIAESLRGSDLMNKLQETLGN